MIMREVLIVENYSTMSKLGLVDTGFFERRHALTG
jgi:hypothetical protein